MTKPLIELDAAIAAMAPMLRSMISRGQACDILRALPTVQPEPAPALGAEWMRREAASYVRSNCWGGEAHAAAIDAIPGPTHEQLLADALALEEVRALVGACRDVIAEREIDGQGDCGCDMCMAVDRMTITIAKLKGDA